MSALGDSTITLFYIFLLNTVSSTWVNSSVQAGQCWCPDPASVVFYNNKRHLEPTAQHPGHAIFSLGPPGSLSHSNSQSPQLRLLVKATLWN